MNIFETIFQDGVGSLLVEGRPSIRNSVSQLARALRLSVPLLGATSLGVTSLTASEDWKSWAETPPMGWNSYDSYHGCITEAQFKQSVDVLAEKLLPHGWEYAVIDFCWYNPGPEGWDAGGDWKTFFVKQTHESDGSFSPKFAMDEYGRLLPSLNRFPSAADGKGFKTIADYVHSKGMKFGIHIMRGIPREAVVENTPVLGTNYTARDIAEPYDYCRWNNNMYGVDASKPGAQEYYNSLFNLYASWGVDYVKADDMTVPVYHKGEIEMMRKAIDQCGREIVLSLSCGETPIPEANHLKEHANLWRISIDFWDEWSDLKHMFDLCNSWAPHIGEGTWPDADMIPFGKLCLSGFPKAHNDPTYTKKAEHESYFTWDEHQTLMTLWAMARSPLMWGGDPTLSSEKTYSYLTNDEVLGILKNSRNNRQLYHKFNGEWEPDRIWVADSTKIEGAKYVALFNLGDEPADVSFKLELENMRGYYQVRDLWTHEDLTPVQGHLKRTLPAHGSALYLLTPVEVKQDPISKVWSREDLRIRDPYVLPGKDGYTYYMYASTTTTNEDGSSVKGVAVYTSVDLQMWHGPNIAFKVPEDSWGKLKVWAPEVHEYQGKYYLFTTLTGEETLSTPKGRPQHQRRATQVFVSDNPMGPFLPFENKPYTPEDWMALDGTLWMENDVPYMIFCHEWIQTVDGTMELIQLKDDLSGVVGESQTLFAATDGEWVRDLGKVGAKYNDKKPSGFVTDGCFLYRTKTDRLLMIWSSFGEQRYAVGMAYSESGTVQGPWKQIQTPLFAADGGHGMIFKTFDGKLMLAIHQPNSKAERAHFFEIQDVGDRLRIVEEFKIPKS